MSTKRLVVIGGGAAGFFCAVNAARLNPKLRVTLLEKSNKLLTKVSVSGGGRCNVTHACFDIAEMSRCYPRGGNFVKKTFHQFFTTDTIRWFEERGVKLKTESDGRIFPVTDSSQTIIHCLTREAGQLGVEIQMKTAVEHIIPPATVKTGEMAAPFILGCAAGKKIEADYICIACGGFSKPAMFDWLKELGHSIEEPVPSLFTFNMPKHPLTQLMGVSINPARVKISGTKLQQEGPVLITHWGLSGPAILKLSAWGARELAGCNWQFSIQVNWLPAIHEQSLAERFKSLRAEWATGKISTKNPFGLPQRFWEFMLEQSGIDKEKRWADLPASEQGRLLRNLTACEFRIAGKTTFKEEFVTAGGIKLNEVDHHTLMSKKVPGIFFAGEILDVDGITGGYNFQHAWTSGFIAAKSIAAMA